MKRAFVSVLACMLGGCIAASAPVRVSTLPAEARAQPAEYLVVTVRNEPAPFAARAGSTRRGYEAVAAYAVSADAQARVAGIARDYGLREVAGWPIAALRVHCVVFRRPQSVSTAELIERLAKDARVELAQPLQTFTTSTSAFNDPYAALQPSLDALGIAQAHRWSRGEGVRVAVIDTGIQTRHPDLKGRIAAQRNFVDEDGAAFERDLHGTQVAGVIAAMANNREGIVGIAPAARLLAYKACWHGAAAAGAVCNTFTLAQALVAALDSGAQIVNLSLSGPADPLLSELVSRGLSAGTIFVGSVPPNGQRDGFPIGIKGVTAVDSSVPSAGASGVLRAPGRDVLTLAPGGHYDFASGSSLAAAHVTGALALLRARQRSVSAADLDQLLARTSERVPTAAGPVESISACGALAVLLTRGSCAALAASDARNTAALR